MESLSAIAPSQESPLPFWRDPIAWVRRKNLGSGYWIFFTSAFFYDAGFAIYFFLFNLYLMDRGFTDRGIGLIGGSFTAGSLVGTLPAGRLERRAGLRSMLIALFIAAPLLNAARALWLWEPAQIALAFTTGFAMTAWGVCFLPAIARLTTEENRTAAFGLIFSASVATTMVGGIVCGYMRGWLEAAGFSISAAQLKEWILLVSCAIVPFGLFAVWRLRFPSGVQEQKTATGSWLSSLRLSPFLRRYLPVMALWSAVLAAFTPFANIYLSRQMHVPMEQVGLMFSLAQGIQLCMGLLVPFVTRLLGLIRGIAAMQAVAAVVLGCMAVVTDARLAMVFYLIFSAAQWMSVPALYNLLMNESPDAERSMAAAMTLFANSLAGAVATAGAGSLFTQFGYPPVLVGIALASLVIALLFLFLMNRERWSRRIDAP
jgi:predicted MFS family arabinose efflux permease